MNQARALLVAACMLAAGAAQARGVSPYLPLHLSPQMERQVEQVLLLAGRPIVRRPIAAATVLDALPEACRIDAALCTQVRAYLDAYMSRYAVTHAGVEAASTRDSSRTLPNSRGMQAGDEWAASVAGHFQLSDYILLQAGGLAYPGEATATGSWLSVGTEYLQLDLGLREHWWSPMSDSAMLIGTQAPTMVSATMSNYTPITRYNLSYEFFLAQMAEVDDIAYQGRTTRGRPRLAGLNLAIEPLPGWSLGVSRILQFAGGERKRSMGDFIDAFFFPVRYDNVGDGLNEDDQFGNQVAALTSKFIFPTRYPFAVYFEYAGEDGSRAEGWRLGNASLSAGIDFPRVFERFDLTYEVSDWQNSWYVNTVYPDGTSNDGHVIGHWGADARLARDAVGAQSHMLRLGWLPRFGGLMELRYRTLQNETYGGFNYEREHDFTLRYSRVWNQFMYGAEVNVGRDVFGEDFRRLGAYVRYVPGQRSFDVGPLEPLPDHVTRNVEVFVDAGISTLRLKYNPSDKGVTPSTAISSTGAHMGIGVRRLMGEHSDLGARIEVDQVDGEMLLAVRAVDYRYRAGRHLAFGAFAGAARYDGPTAAYGYYGGVSAQWRDVLPRLDLTLDMRVTDKMARDVLLADDPDSAWGDMVYELYGASLYLSYRF